MKSSPYSIKTHALPDEVVVARILNGEKELFEILLRRYNQTLFRVIRSYAPTQEITEDIMQDTYVKAFCKLNQYRHGSSFSTWLIRIGINEALQAIRSNKRKPPMADSGSETKVIQLPDTNYMQPDRIYQNQELKALIEHAVDKLPQKYKTIFVMHEAEHMSNTEIANCLGLTVSNVKVRLHRAKNLLKVALLQETRGENLFEYGNTRCDRMVENVMHLITPLSL